MLRTSLCTKTYTDIRERSICFEVQKTIDSELLNIIQAFLRLVRTKHRGWDDNHGITLRPVLQGEVSTEPNRPIIFS